MSSNGCNNSIGGFGTGIYTGIVLASTLIFWISRLTAVNISDAELYRFCMVRKIELIDCKIPPKEQKVVEK